MAATYADISTLEKDQTFIDRIAVAIQIYSKFILAEAPTVPFHINRMRYATANINNSPLNTAPAYQVSTIVANDPIFAAMSPIDHKLVTDAQFQAAVESAINATILG